MTVPVEVTQRTPGIQPMGLADVVRKISKAQAALVFFIALLLIERQSKNRRPGHLLRYLTLLYRYTEATSLKLAGN